MQLQKAEPNFRSRTLYVIRHGECEHNVEGRYAGQDDSPLTGDGRGQARENGLLLKSLLSGAPPCDFIASPLHRTCVTMELVRNAAGLPQGGYRADRRLMELDLGHHSWQLIAQVAASAEHTVYQRDPWNYRRPGGESHAMLHRRVGELLHTLDRDTVLVCHAGSARMIRAHCLNLTPEACLRHEPPHAGIILLSNGVERVVTPPAAASVRQSI